LSSNQWNAFCILRFVNGKAHERHLVRRINGDDASGKDMKIYLLLMLLGTLLTVVHFTSTPEPRSKMTQ